MFLVFRKGLKDNQIKLFISSAALLFWVTSELAKANAIFIGFIHTVLQISHTFSAKYIQGDFSFDETAQSNQLVQKTVRHAVEQLTLRVSEEKSED